MEKADKDWRDRTIEVASKSRDRDSAIWVSSQLVTEFKIQLRKAISDNMEAFDEDEIDEFQSGIIKGYQNVLKLIDTVLPPQ